MSKLLSQFRTTVRQAAVALVIAVQVFMPVSLFAQEVLPADTPSTEGAVISPPVEAVSQPIVTQTETQPTTPLTGPQLPTGAESTTYAYNEGSGLWENDHYTWDPATNQTKPKTTPQYSFNAETGLWDTTEWYYSPEQGKYLPNTVSTEVAPVGMTIDTPYNATADSIGNTGPSSDNEVTNTGTTSGIFDLFFDAAISNKIGQMSQSGNASVLGNTSAGSALTGDAKSIANVLNMIQSNWTGFGSQDIALFLANIDGNVVGDLYVDPSALANNAGNTTLDVNVANDAAIHNDIAVTVASGDALVNGNTTAGDATSGDAKAVVNLFNLINSAISANQSFIGLLNINGNLNGDILLPQSMLNAIIAATGPNSTNQIVAGSNTSLNATVVDNKTINNDITAAATSGNAAVTDNTTAGNATTGKADTNIVLLNLTGKRVVAKNAMLVFVNVMGSWVGVILDAPAGTNAVVATGPGSNNSITDTQALTVNADVESNSLIQNDVNVLASSGDAEVSGNTTGGNASSGDALIGVNVVNMIDSQFEISDWFGILFINVFGNWVGSFGVNTSAGNMPAPSGVVGPTTTAAGNSGTTKTAQTFAFVPAASFTGSREDSPGVVAAAATSAPEPPAGMPVAATSPSDPSSGIPANASNNGLWMAAVVILLGMIMLAGERLITQFRGRQLA